MTDSQETTSRTSMERSLTSESASSTSTIESQSKHDHVVQDDYPQTTVDVTNRIDLDFSSKHLGLVRQVSKLGPPPESIDPRSKDTLPSWLIGQESNVPPPLNIVVQVVGSRGDVQPFIALGRLLKSKYGHRIRIATHATFQNFVEENDLEFYSIGGDPRNLMEYMVKNPGLVPGRDSLIHGDVSRRRREIQEILEGCWRSCVATGDGMPVSGHEKGGKTRDDIPFIANAIIANPVSFAHVHCAEKLGVPVHFMFTMPWSATQAFPHPLANIKSNNQDPRAANYLSYQLVTMLTFQGLGSVINKFRQDTLGLEAVSQMWFPALVGSGKIPFTYCWSPSLVRKPGDWGSNIHVAGFYFLPLASKYKPDPALAAFLQNGPPPVYIGFGSIVVADPNALTNLIFKATKRAGVRALVSKGWGGLGSNDLVVPENCFLLGNVPHDYLFQHVSAVCHHGGAGTTAAGIAAGKPTIVVPFFGDQPFWGAMINRAGAGPPPIAFKQLTVDKLAAAIEFCLKPDTQTAAQRMAAQIAEEDGPAIGARHFNAHLPINALRCSIFEDCAAVWRVKRTKIRLSPKAAAILSESGLVQYSDLKLNRAREYDMTDQPTDPILAGLTAIFGSVAGILSDTATLGPDFIKFVRTETSLDQDIEARRVSMMPVSPVGASAHGPASGDLAISKAAEVPYRFSTRRRRTLGAAKLVGRETAHLAHLPRELVVNVARGFHNAPKLYHDRTVRPQLKVTDLKSGLRSAGMEFGYGVGDGITGLVTQPWHGAKEGGAIGLGKGVAKGLGGFLLKPAAGIFGVVGQAWDGLYKEAHHYYQDETFRFDPSSQSWRFSEEHIRSTWLLEGYQALRTCTEADREHAVSRWNQIQLEMTTLKTEKDRARAEKWCPRKHLAARHMSKSTSVDHGSITSMTTTTSASSTEGSLLEELDGIEAVAAEEKAEARKDILPPRPNSR